MRALVGHPDYTNEILAELKDYKIEVMHRYKNIFLIEDENTHLFWPKDQWFHVEIVKFKSISDAVKILKSKAKLWTNHPYANFRKAELIQKQLPVIKFKNLEFPNNFKNQSKYASWMLISDDEMIVSKRSLAAVPLGDFLFAETKEPPSRAYLKLWESFTRLQFKPTKDEVVLDFGSCPGGWTWVLSQLAKKVISVDGAPLDEKVMKLQNVEFYKKDAFKLKVTDFENIDWFFSDIICEPKDLYEIVNYWMQNSGCQKFICSIKFKGPSENAWAQKFLQIPNSTVLHLYNNKHELTWIKHPSIN